MKKTLANLILLAAMLLAVSPYCQAQLPSVQIKDLKGKPVDTSTLGNDGKPFIIDFWDTKCKPCIRELTAISEVYPDWVEETGVKIYAISTDDAQNAFKVKSFVEKKGWEYEFLIDSNRDFARAMGASNNPHTIVIDGKGNIVESHAGYTEGSEEHLYELIKKIILK